MRRQISTNFSPNGHSTSRSTSLSRNSLDRYISTARPRNYTLLGPTDDASIFYWTNTPSPVNAAYSHTQRASHSSTASPISPVSDASALYSPSPPSNFSSLSPPQYQNASHHRSPSSRSTRPNTPLPPYRSSTTRSQSNRVPRPQTAQTVGTLGTTGTLRSSQRSLVPEGSIAWTEYSAQQILRGRRTPSSSLDDLVLQDENIVIIPMTPSQDPRTKVRDSESPAEAIGDDLLRLVREVQERVLGVWSSGATISSDASFGFLLRFEPPADASTWTGSSPTNILPYRRTGVWATKSPEGTAALRILVTLFSTLAEHGYSFMAATQSPQQYIFYATPSQDLPSQRFLAMEIRVYPPKRTRVVPKKSYRLSFFGRSAWSAASSSTAETSSSLPHSESASDWANTSRVEIRCVDFPLPLTQALIRAVRNANPISMDHWWEATTIEEKWSTPPTDRPYGSPPFSSPSQSNRTPYPQTIGTSRSTPTQMSSHRSLMPDGSFAWTEYSAQQILRGWRTSSSSPDGVASQDENIVIIPMMPSQDSRMSAKVCISFPTSHTMRISTLSAFRRRDSESPVEGIEDDLLDTVREVQERVLGVWSSGATISSDTSFGFLLHFEPPVDAATWTGSSTTNSLPYRKTGSRATESLEGTAALRILVTLFSTLADHGYSFMAATQSPQQYIFYATPTRVHPPNCFLAMEIRIYSPKRTRVVPKKPSRLSSLWNSASWSTAGTASSLLHGDHALDWAHTSRVEMRCVDFPLPLTQALISAVRNANPVSMYHRWEAAAIEEKWNAPSIRVLEALVRRGEGRSSKTGNEMDALLTLTSCIIEAMDNEGFVFDASISSPEDTSWPDTFTPGLLGRERSKSRLWGLFKSKSNAEQEACEREVWMFKGVCSYPVPNQSLTTEHSQE
ncbi:hypothetical protein FRB99_002728 [Tulasnella sp. 403]|nr:hypothetical protein FRB99_002728 [Tulasnella sp. 403]